MHYDAAVFAGFPAYYGNAYGQWASNLSETGAMTREADYMPRDWESQPPYRYANYKSTALRGPTKPLVPLKQTLSELTGPVYGHESVGPLDHDLTKNGVKDGEPLGERIVVTGRGAR